MNDATKTITTPALYPQIDAQDWSSYAQALQAKDNGCDIYGLRDRLEVYATLREKIYGLDPEAFKAPASPVPAPFASWADMMQGRVEILQDYFMIATGDIKDAAELVKAGDGLERFLVDLTGQDLATLNGCNPSLF